MSKMYSLQINKEKSMEEAWEQLELAGFTIAFGEEEENHSKLYIYAESPNQFDKYSWIECCDDYQLPEINWNQQWQIHGIDFRDGYVHVDLNQFSRCASILKLEPGPGFGDLSHPTTCLALHLMGKYITNQPVIDIGSGSGILTLAALALGSSIAYGIDIDTEALKHSKKNAEINGMDTKCQFKLPDQFKLPQIDQEWLIVMNMISSEQKIAWDSLPALHDVSGMIITTGVTKEEREIYLKLAFDKGWQLIDEIDDGDWLAFCFTLNVK